MVTRQASALALTPPISLTPPLALTSPLALSHAPSGGDQHQQASGAQVLIDLAAVTHNVQTLAAAANGELMAVVKANGFGHGGYDVARTALANGATRLGVTSLAEAIPLRHAWPDARTVPILSWLNGVDADYTTASRLDIEVAVPSLDHLAGVASTPGCLRIHLHIDVDMARDGAPPEMWPQLCRSARQAETQFRVDVVGIMGHLGCGGDPASLRSQQARERFSWAIQVAHDAGLRPYHHHLAATAATLSDPSTHHTMSRIGAGLVGIDPTGSGALRPPMTLTAPVTQVRHVPAHTPVGYGDSYHTTQPTYLGLVPLGYADGLPRAASNRAEVLVAGRRCPVVGWISMDQTVIDLGPSGAKVGEVATIFGPGEHGEPTVSEWARWADTIEHEIVTAVGSSARATRQAINAPGYAW